MALRVEILPEADAAMRRLSPCHQERLAAAIRELAEGRAPPLAAEYPIDDEHRARFRTRWAVAVIPADRLDIHVAWVWEEIEPPGLLIASVLPLTPELKDSRAGRGRRRWWNPWTW